jgi:hypothetical protein
MYSLLYLALAGTLLNQFPQDTKNVENTKAYLYSYFEKNIGPNGGVFDRESDRNLISVAATGFAFKVWALAATSSRPQVSREEACRRINQSFDFIISNNPPSNKNWLFHFYYSDGSIPPNTEVSTVDTAIFYLGARQAAWDLLDLPLIFKVNYYFYQIDIAWMLKDCYIIHGFHYSPSGEIIPIEYSYSEYSEGIMIYKLFNIPFSPAKIDYSLPLFTFYYPLCFYDDSEMVGHLKKAISCQKEKYGNWGRSALDTENKGYQAFEANTISPLTILTISSYLNIDDETTRKYSGLAASKDVLTGWESRDKVGIDAGCDYILLSKIGENN